MTLPEDDRETTSVPDAARALGITERAVRKRIQAGSLSGELVGGRWYVVLSRSEDVSSSRPALAQRPNRNAARASAPAHRNRARPEPGGSDEGSGAGSDVVPAGHATELLKMLRELQQQNLELAGQVGFLQARLATAQDQLLLAEHQEGKEPKTQADTEPVPFLRRLFRR
ncbi:MAG TPA: hypothetical protein DEV93_18275 [Chloroflexi bacterium]|nr:hypothetical protein [Chloroflexota bacterium]